jgi:glycerate-2-kinase
MATYISNFEELATTPLRRDALTIVESAYEAIDTRAVITKHCRLDGEFLSVEGHSYNIRQFEHVYLLGIGKASSTAIATLEDVLGDIVSEGVVIDKSPVACRIAEVYKGDHPLPTVHNVEISEKIADLANKATEKDLVIVVVSGGGSSLLCYPLSECEQGNKLYETFLSTGGSISELNTLRKHISSLKGGGLAKLLYPATVVSLIFSDVPGDSYENVASGPTYKDISTEHDAIQLLSKYGIQNTFMFNETPKEDMYFEKVTNIRLVSNVHAVQGMETCARSLGYDVVLQSTEEYREASVVLADMKQALHAKTVVIVAGEPSVVVDHPGDKSGRNEYAGGKALSIIEDNEVCIPFATDGIDNKSDAAGVIIDTQVLRLAEEKGINITEYLNQGKHDELCKLLGIQIITGPTGSNVSDCLIYICGDKITQLCL